MGRRKPPWQRPTLTNSLTPSGTLRLPILHLNGYKINNSTILARISHEELENLFKGYGYTPYFVEGSDRETMHQAVAATLVRCEWNAAFGIEGAGADGPSPHERQSQRERRLSTQAAENAGIPTVRG